MSEADDAPDMAQPAANPDAQTTVNDFLDYTEFFPSDLVRSLTLIGDLDASYHEAVHHVHDLTVLYGKLPALPEHERPDPTLLRKQIAQHLQAAVSQREYAFAEASRLYEVTVRHCQRSSVIKRKLQAQPQPPSRDPTPPPISPNAQRLAHRTYERRLPFDTGRHAPNSSRPRDRHRKPAASLPRRRSRTYSASSDSSVDDSDTRSAIDVAITPRKHKPHRDRHPKSGRSRHSGALGTSSYGAGISTSNALAQLAPPPPDARPGSKWAPWGKLTEYEMAVLRKQMKKNAVWEPSLTMVNRELERKHRTMADYDRELARCEAAGEEILNEEPETLQQITTTLGLIQTEAHSAPAEEVLTPVDTVKEYAKENSGAVSIRLKPVEPQDSTRLDRLSQRQQAIRDAQELVDATEKIVEAANSLKELTFSPHSATASAGQKRRTPARPSNKRKRDGFSQATTEDSTESAGEGSVATQDSGTRAPESKRPRLYLATTSPDATSSPIPTPTTAVSTPRDFPTSLAASSIPNTPVPLPEPSKVSSNATTVQVPLAPAGPSTPKPSKATSKEFSRDSSPTATSPEDSKFFLATAVPAQSAGPQPTMTAASSRPRRESVAPKTASPPTASAQSLKASKASTPALDTIPDAPPPAIRPRSARGHVPTPKAQSEEPKPNEVGRVGREGRRHSTFSQSALTAAPSTRMSSRKKPPPKGEVTAAEDGQKTVTNVKRSQGSKNKKKKKAEEETETADYIDPDEERYCFCDDVSYGPMISCDNNCDREWFHLPCVNMSEKDIPSRRARWFCPECRKALGVDSFGNPLIPPPLPGRRGNK